LIRFLTNMSHSSLKKATWKYSSERTRSWSSSCIRWRRRKREKRCRRSRMIIMILWVKWTISITEVLIRMID